MSKQKFEPIDRALYLGRRKLGRYVQTDEQQFEGFGPDDRSLGYFETGKQVLAAIRDACALTDRVSHEIIRIWSDGDR